MTKKEMFIYERCVELLKSGLIDKMSMDDIANYIPVSKVTIYKYFKSRELLMEKVFIFFLKDIIVDNNEFYGIDKIKLIIDKEIEKSSVNVKLMTSIVENASDECKEEIRSIQNTAMNTLVCSFNESKEQGYFKGFLFDDFINMYTIYMSGIVNSKNIIDCERSIKIFSRLILNTN